MKHLVSYFIIKEKKQIDNEWYSKDIYLKSLEDIQLYIDEHPNVYKLDIRVVRKVVVD